MLEILKKLNKKQEEAVVHGNGPLLIVAGAGTGKTTVLVNRLAYLINEKKVDPANLLLLTFTEKAAGEMEDRADQIMPYGYTESWISTFHGFGERLLRESALDIGLNPGFKLLSQTEQWMLIRKNLDRFNLDYYRPLGNPTKFISELITHFSRLKDENISSAEYLALAEEKRADLDRELGGVSWPLDNPEAQECRRLQELASAYHVYNQLLSENNSLDFGDLIIQVIRLFKERPNILKHYRDRFHYIMVDEFQDTNYAQYEMVKLLAAPKNNLVVVGDDDQAIYKFRGASLSNIMQFKDDYPEAKEIILCDNYRSRQEILDRAYNFIQHNNPNRLEEKLHIEKRLLSKKEGDSPAQSVHYLNLADQEEEVAFVAAKIKDLKASNNQLSWADFAILVRANDAAEAFVKGLSAQDIPCQFMSWRGLYYKPLILDILAYFHLLDNYHESTALFRVLNMDAFRVSHADLIEINKMAARKVWSLFEALKNINLIKEVGEESRKNITRLLNLITEHSALAAKASPSQLYLRFVYDSGLLSELDEDRDLEQFSYLNQFYQKIKRFEDSGQDIRLKDFLEAMNLELEAGESGSLKLDFADNDVVKIMTVHGAKGLEFQYVFLPGLVDKRFPTIARGEKISLPDELIKEKSLPNKDAHLEEERRLFYVAVTRAKEELFVLAAKDYGGAREKKPSRFIEETGLVDEANADSVSLSQKNQFLRDFHFANSRQAEVKKPLDKESYPLPDKFSFSQLAAFSTCPLQYKYAFILKIPADGDKASLIFGRVMHNVLYNFLLPFLEERRDLQGSLFPEEAGKTTPVNLLNEKRLGEIYEEFWQPDGFSTKKDREEYREKGKKSLKLFFSSYLEHPPTGIVFLEKKFSFRIGSDIIKGTIDRVDRLPSGALEVIDYKTGSPKEKLDFQDKRQLILYYLFLEEYLGEKIERLSYYYLEDGSKISFLPTPDEITKLRKQISEEIAAIKKREFTATPSPMCRYCDFRSICEFRQL
jgi:DNA helicase-2/ATP-dependent DNA helicase PcrA